MIPPSKERKLWKKRFERGIRVESPWLEDYEKNRYSNLWRSTRGLEKLCEYILYLESKMTENVKCAQCGKVIGKEPLNPEEVAKHYFGDDENKCENTATKRFADMFEAWKNRDENKKSKICPKCGMQRVQDGMCWELTCSYREPDNE